MILIVFKIRVWKSKDSSHSEISMWFLSSFCQGYFDYSNKKFKSQILIKENHLRYTTTYETCMEFLTLSHNKTKFLKIKRNRYFDLENWIKNKNKNLTHHLNQKASFTYYSNNTASEKYNLCCKNIRFTCAKTCTVQDQITYLPMILILISSF